jgi:hypothetical protein
MRNLHKWLLALGVATVLFGAIMFTQHSAKVNEQKLKSQMQKLEAQTKSQHDAEVENLKKQIQEQDSKYKQLEQSKAAEKARIAAENAQKAAQASLAQRVVQTAVPTAQAATGDAKAFIYAKESGNNPGAINASSGACGLGQALPCSKMPCSLSDYACQDNFFTGYMLHRYGSWENARAFWLAHRWW